MRRIRMMAPTAHKSSPASPQNISLNEVQQPTKEVRPEPEQAEPEQEPFSCAAGHASKIGPTLSAGSRAVPFQSPPMPLVEAPDTHVPYR